VNPVQVQAELADLRALAGDGLLRRRHCSRSAVVAVRHLLQLGTLRRVQPAQMIQAGAHLGLHQGGPALQRADALQLALGGFNVATELRYRRFWFEYSHGVALNLNDLGGFSLTGTERAQDLHVYMPYTTGFGVGFTILDELWLGVEFKTHRYDVNAPGGAVSSYQTYSIGPVLGYKAFLYKGLFADAYLRYWPNVASSLTSNEIALRGTDGTVEHSAHDFGVFANVSIGYAFDL